MATFSVHFDGPITIDHKVPIRVLARTYEHMQRAIDRAYLINTYGDVWKHARLTAEQYRETEFIAEYPREGGIILDAVKQGGGIIVDRIYSAIRPIYEVAISEAVLQHSSLREQFMKREEYVKSVGENTKSYMEFASDPPPDWANKYSNRSVTKEIDQLVTQVSPKELQGSTVELTLNGAKSHLPLMFNSKIASRFHEIASYRELGAPIIINAFIRSLDRGNKHTKPSAKIFNLDTEKELNLVCHRHGDADTLHPYHNGEPVRLYVCPLIEALGFDVMRGDMVFIAVA